MLIFARYRAVFIFLQQKNLFHNLKYDMPGLRSGNAIQKSFSLNRELRLTDTGSHTTLHT